MVLAIVLTWITNRNKKDAITSYIYAVTLWILYCYIITESLSFGNLLTRTGEYSLCNEPRNNQFYFPNKKQIRSASSPPSDGRKR